MDENTHVIPGKGWSAALLFSMAISALYLYLFYRWFALADRYYLFLYYHDMGPWFKLHPYLAM
jgi:hypothetical protein